MFCSIDNLKGSIILSSNSSLNTNDISVHPKTTYSAPSWNSFSIGLSKSFKNLIGSSFEITSRMIFSMECCSAKSGVITSIPFLLSGFEYKPLLIVIGDASRPIFLTPPVSLSRNFSTSSIKDIIFTPICSSRESCSGHRRWIKH